MAQRGVTTFDCDAKGCTTTTMVEVKDRYAVDEMPEGWGKVWAAEAAEATEVRVYCKDHWRPVKAMLFGT